MVATLESVVAENHQPLDVVRPAPVADPGYRLPHALGADRIGVKLGPPVRQSGVDIESVAVAVVRSEMPIQLPDVFPPAQDLTNEALGGLQRGNAVPVGLLGGRHGVQWVQHTKVERDRQQRVRHGPVPAHHGVFVAAESRQAVGNEPIEGGSGFGGGDGEQSRPVHADGVVASGVEVAAHLRIDIVLPGE